jgi:tetratricopeptide (TPR) repeat protein
MQPSNADFYHNRGFSNRKLGRYGAATEDYSAALRLNPTHFKVLLYEALRLLLCPTNVLGLKTSPPPSVSTPSTSRY